VVSKPAPAPIEKNSGKKAVVAAGPAIRRFAREVGVDLQMIQGSGEHGRIVREDVLKVVREGSRQSGGSSSAASGRQSDGYGPVHVEKMPKIRQTIAKKMHESWTTCPRVTNFDDADVTALEEIRQNSKKRVCGWWHQAHLDAVPCKSRRDGAQVSSCD
jgi:pyruvate/2-oxoglutarate dehydrogenase complex dihydrolipoamide acyltransferase (E2) component